MTRSRGFDNSVKTIIVGDSGVGKTSILNRFVRDTYQDSTPTTLGVEFLSRIVEYGTRRIELQLWDTAGQELFRAIIRGYYRGAIAAYIVYDCGDRRSFEHVEQWLTDVRSTADPQVVPILLANKSDLEHRQVTAEEGQKLADDLKMLFFEVSAKTGDNVETGILSSLAAVVKLLEGGTYDGKMGVDALVLSYDDAPESSPGCC
jgi:small GTP-binding protein